MADSRKDTPLADSPEPKMNVQGIFADIEKRSKERNEARALNQKKVNEAREARRSRQGNTQTGPSKLYGLASFSSTTGKE